MKLLIVLSSNDFDNFTRRATVEAICKHHPDTTLLFFNGVKGYPIGKPSNKQLKWKAYYSLSLGKGKRALRNTELSLAGLYWKPFIRSFDTVFLTDPNQELILDYLNASQKLLYLIRDPNVLLSENNYGKEKRILSMNPHVFGISKALCNDYLKDHYPDVSLSNVTYWPNTVDLNVWDYKKYQHIKPATNKVVAGMVGNITRWNDLELVEYIVKENPDVTFEFYGKNLLKEENLIRFGKICEEKNMNYRGYLPFKDTPKVVAQWNIGLVIGRNDIQFSKYWGNNKLYQYMAMGKPFVTYAHNDEYEKFGQAAFIAKSRKEYSQKIKEALAIAGKPKTIQHCLQVASENSSEVRAREFLSILNTMHKKK
ncbi:MAG: hypothetical protein ACOCVN_01445 [bacterium]